MNAGTAVGWLHSVGILVARGLVVLCVFVFPCVALAQSVGQPVGQPVAPPVPPSVCEAQERHIEYLQMARLQTDALSANVLRQLYVLQAHIRELEGQLQAAQERLRTLEGHGPQAAQHD